ncbi:MAG: hypothetical protein C4292_00430 [Nitrososphaera sp.]
MKRRLFGGYFLIVVVAIAAAASASATTIIIVASQYFLPTHIIHPTIFDKFGIGEIYPTRAGWMEWYVDMAYPKSDPYFRNLADIQFSKQQDGSWQIYSTNGQVRMEAWSPPNQKWLNVEITEYAKIVNSTNHLLQMYSRGGNHIYSNPCIGSAYKARLFGDGTATWIKEVTFPAYTEEQGKVRATEKPVDDRWVGFKAVIYNFVENGNTYVRMESYIDDDVTDPNGNLVIKNNWKLASVVEDKGGLATDNNDFDPRCGVPRDAILATPGGSATQNIVAWRTDNTIWDFKYLTAREIQPPATN